MADRTCGDCSECCTALALTSFKKPAGVKCKHVRNGCAIYGNRPRECKSYECLWLQGVFEEHDRPDEIGCIFEDAIGPNPGVVCREMKSDASKSGRAAEIIREINLNAVPVIVVDRCGVDKRLELPVGMNGKLTGNGTVEVTFKAVGQA